MAKQHFKGITIALISLNDALQYKVIATVIQRFHLMIFKALHKTISELCDIISINNRC
jgi:hypothetical protein